MLRATDTEGLAGHLDHIQDLAYELVRCTTDDAHLLKLAERIRRTVLDAKASLQGLTDLAPRGTSRRR